MRGDMALTARLLVRGTGLAGLVVVAGGLLAVLAATRPWFVAVAEVAMLDVVQDRAIGVQPGLPTPAGWVALGAGAMAVFLGGAIALDRPPTAARAVLAVVAGALLLMAAWAWLAPPPALTELAGTEGAQLARLADRLPAGVELDFRVRASLGPWLAAIAAAMVAGGTLAAREL